MTTQDVAKKLVALCREGKHLEATLELYADNAVSVEPDGAPAPRVEGKEAILKKGEQWASSVEEVHEGIISDPIVAGNHFSCTMAMDITFKGMGRMKMEEVCLYKVQDGKIVYEEFFYSMN